MKCPVTSPQLLGVVLSILSRSQACTRAEHHMSPNSSATCCNLGLPHKLRGFFRTNLQREPIAAGAFATRKAHLSSGRAPEVFEAIRLWLARTLYLPPSSLCPLLLPPVMNSTLIGKKNRRSHGLPTRFNGVCAVCKKKGDT